MGSHRRCEGATGSLPPLNRHTSQVRARLSEPPLSGTGEGLQFGEKGGGRGASE